MKPGVDSMNWIFLLTDFMLTVVVKLILQPISQTWKLISDLEISV